MINILVDILRFQFIRYLRPKLCKKARSMLVVIWVTNWKTENQQPFPFHFFFLLSSYEALLPFFLSLSRVTLCASNGADGDCAPEL